MDRDYSGLVISGSPSEDEIKKAWESIYQEYLQLDQSGKYNEIIEKTKNVQNLNAQVLFVEMAVDRLQYGFNSDLVTCINNLGIECDLMADDAEKVAAKKLKLTLTRAKTWIADLQRANAELESSKETNETHIDSRLRFEENLDALSHYRKYSVRAEEITVRQYAKAIGDMERYYRRMSAKHNII